MKKTNTLQIVGLALITLGCLLLAVGLVRADQHHSSSGLLLAAVLVEGVGVAVTTTQMGRRR